MAAGLSELLVECGLEEHRDFLLQVSRPMVELVACDAPVVPGCSKFGGAPDLPPDFEWPWHELGPYRFIGQMNLGEIPKGPHGLPQSGMLSFFYAYDEEGESFWGDPDYVRVYRFAAIETLAPWEPPTEVRLGATSVLSFRLGEDVPSWPWGASERAKWPIDEGLDDAYRELRSRLHASRKYLLGYPTNYTLAFDPTPGPEWRSLLTLNSDDALEWCWHDGDRLVGFIETKALYAGDFSKIQCAAG